MAALVVAALALGLAACGTDGSGTDASGRLRVVAAFYPLQWIAERVGGRHVVVTNLTTPGVEPHDLELTPRDIAAVDDAALVLHLSGFQPAVDGAIADTKAPAFDVADHTDLDLTLASAEHGSEESPGGGDHPATDPHVWLDPIRLAEVVDALADTLADRDPAHVAAYRANAAATVADLRRLDRAYRAGLANCANRHLVTGHAAFGYLAHRYHLTQVAIAGISPDTEPSAGQLAAVTRAVERHHVRTVYTETLVSPAVAEAIADEAGVATAVLDPIEGITDDSAGDDYLAVMRSNLATLRAGQPCA